MQVVDDIFEAFGGPSAIAAATGFPLQTVSDWRRKGQSDIPPWRRGAVLEAARREGRALEAHCLEYLQSTKRPDRAA